MCCSFITQPNMYARGILFGKMKYELGDHAQVRCPETGLEVDIEFKVKGWMGGTYNSIGGFIKDTKSGKNLYELSGFWHGEMSIKDLTTGKKEVLFDATRAKPSYPKSRPLSEQAPRESQKLWKSTTDAIKKADQRTATDEKSKIEDEQRREAAERGEGAVWQPKLFKAAPRGDEAKLDWVIDAEVDNHASPEKQVEQILAIAPIIPGQEASKDFSQAKSLPSQQNKPLPDPPQEAQHPQQQSQQPQSTQKQPQPSQQHQGNDLIDFGQNDTPPEAAGSQRPPTIPPQQTAESKLQEPLMPEPGNPVRRMDSMGNEDTFIDAET